MGLREAELTPAGAGPCPRSGRRSGPALRRAALGALLAAALPTAALAQQSLLERWSVGHVADRWSARWGTYAEGAGTPDSAGVRARAFVEALELGTGLHERRSGAEVRLRRPLAGRFHAGVSARSDAWSSEAAGRPFLGVERSEAVALDLGWRGAAPLAGRVGATAGVGWSDGVGGRVSVESRSERHALEVDAWRTGVTESRVSFPADSLRELGSRIAAWGGRTALALTLPVAGVELRPSATWRRDLLHPDASPSGLFLDAPATGSSTRVSLALGAAGAAWGASGGWHRSVVDLEGDITRGGLSAGALPIARLELRGWRGEAWLDGGGGRWSAALGRDELEGALSTRVETWPFTDFWGTISAQAYRLRGDLVADWLWGSLEWRGEAPSGWELETSLALGALEADRDSWYVTSFGFGRDDRVITVGGVDDVVVVGVSARRGWPLGGGRLDTRLEIAVPAYARPLPAATAASGDDGVSGYLSLSLDWWQRGPGR